MKDVLNALNKALGGREPSQIALAILAEIEMVRHGGSGRPRSEAMMHPN